MARSFADDGVRIQLQRTKRFDSSRADASTRAVGRSRRRKTANQAGLGRAEQYVRFLWRPADAQALPKIGTGIESGIRDSALPHAGSRLRTYSSVGRRHRIRSEEHTSELQSPVHLVCRLLL